MSATVNACDGQEGGNTVFTKPNDHQDKTTQEEMSPERNPEDTKAEEGISGDDGTNFHPGARFYLAFSSLAVLAMMVSLDGTSVSVALPIMAADLNGTAIEAFWTGTSFLLSSAVFQPSIAALSHIFGRMSALVCCTVFFLVGIIVSSVAQSFTPMLIGRTIQGVGGGGIILLNDIVITDLVPMRLRGAYFGIIGGVWALGAVSGPVIGGALAVNTTWRWIFWINIPFAVIALIMVPLFLRLKRTPGSIPQKLKRVDWVGNFLFIGSTTSFLIPVTWGGIQFPWDSPSTLVPLLVGIAGMVGFWFYEKKVAVEPTIKLNLLKNYNMAYSMYATVINALIVYGALYFLPLYFEAAKGYNPVVAGVALFPATFTVAPLSIIAGFIITKTGDYRVVTWIGWIATTLGCGVMVLLDADSTIPQWVFLTFCMGIGLGLLYTSLVFITQTASDDSSMAFAIGMFVFARILGQCIGVAICGTIFQNQMRENLLDIPSLAEQAHEYSRDATSLVQAIKVMPDSTMKTELIGAYADSLKIVWAVMCVLSTTALVGSFFVRKYSLDRALNTEQGLVDGKKGKEKSDVN